MGAEGVRAAAAAAEEVIDGLYRETERGIVRLQVIKGQLIEFPLTGFTARIVANISRDDGAEISRAFEIEAHLYGQTARFSVPAAQFTNMRWALEHLGSRAVVYAGAGTADHARTAIQLLSRSVSQRRIFAHTGWREIGGQWLYLHGRGAIGAAGAVEGVEVELPPELSCFVLDILLDPTEAIRASLNLLNLGPDGITVPLYGSIWRALLGGSDFSIFLYGYTGTFKTETAALVQQHFGSGFDARHLSTSFTSTANVNEALAFVAKDAVLVVDELHPPASGSEREQMHRDAARLLRSQGNAAGRGRMRADGTLRPSKPPRGLMVATGEELPRGQSVHARLLTLEVQAGAIDAAKLTACQRDAAAGLYAQATAAFIRWLAPRLDDVRAEFEALRREAREQVRHEHARTADVRAQLTATYSIFIKFLLDTGAIDEAGVEQFQRRIGAAIEGAAKAQAQFSSSAEPTEAFIRLLVSAISAGRAHLADLSGGAPLERESACGWRCTVIGFAQSARPEWQPHGDRVGWIDADYVYLDRDAAYRAAQSMAADGGGIEVSATTLLRRLRDRGLLARTDPSRQVLTMRITAQGRRADVVCLLATKLSLLSPQSDQPDQNDENGRVSGLVTGRENRGL